MKTFFHVSVALLYCLFSISISWADGIQVGKVYHPYVLANERELEWRLTSRQNDDGMSWRSVLLTDMQYQNT
jgi:hypothetical protein